MKISGSSEKSSRNSRLLFKRILTIILFGALLFIGLAQNKADKAIKVESQKRIEDQKRIDAQRSAQERQQKKDGERAQFLFELNEYRLGLLTLDPERRFIEDAYAPFPNVSVVYVQMSDEFVYQHKIDRLQLAQDLHQIWKKKSTDTATLFYLVDRNQNRLSEMDWGKIIIEE